VSTSGLHSPNDFSSVAVVSSRLEMHASRICSAACTSSRRLVKVTSCTVNPSLISAWICLYNSLNGPWHRRRSSVGEFSGVVPAWIGSTNLIPNVSSLLTIVIRTEGIERKERTEEAEEKELDNIIVKSVTPRRSRASAYKLPKWAANSTTGPAYAPKSISTLPPSGC
jgi:hypothetical protein